MDNFLNDEWHKKYDIGGYVYCPESSVVSKYCKDSFGVNKLVSSNSLRNKENELLFLIVASYPNLISRDCILQKLWGGYNEVSASSTLTQTLKGVRSAFGDEGKELIITVPRVGIRIRQCEEVDIEEDTICPSETEHVSTNLSDPNMISTESSYNFVKTKRRGRGNIVWRCLSICILIMLVALGLINQIWIEEDIVWIYPINNEKSIIQDIKPIKGELVVVDRYKGEWIACSSNVKNGYCYQY